jgi:hypothetical protein
MELAEQMSAARRICRRRAGCGIASKVCPACVGENPNRIVVALTSSTED